MATLGGSVEFAFKNMAKLCGQGAKVVKGDRGLNKWQTFPGFADARPGAFVTMSPLACHAAIQGAGSAI